MKYRNYYCSPRYSEGDKAYYGNVEGAPQIPMIEAGSLEDFERLLHQAIDDYLERKSIRRSSSNWGRIIFLLAVIGVIVASILTCPKKEQHIAAISNVVSSILNDELTEDSDGFETLGVMLGNAIAAPIIRNSITVDDYIVCSIGKYNYQGDEQVVSIGAFGHVFTVSKEKVKKAIKEFGY